MSDLIQRALVSAAVAHRSHLRKYTLIPYIYHPMEVAQILWDNVDEVTPEMSAAALLHDTVEDTDMTIEEVHEAFGPVVAQLVDELTDKFTHEAYPNMNRAARKQAERERLASISPEAQTIKLADLISNTKDIVKNDPNFAVKYLREKYALLEVMKEGDQDLYIEARLICRKGARKLGIEL